MSVQRAKGSGWETELLDLLRPVFGPQVNRAPLRGTQDFGDFNGLPEGLLLEAKKTDVPHYLQWGKTCTKKAGNFWAILWSGDRRRSDGPFVLLPLSYYLELAKSRHGAT